MINYIVCVLRNLRCRKWSNGTCFLIGVFVFIIGYLYWMISSDTQSPVVSDVKEKHIIPVEDDYVERWDNKEWQSMKNRTVISDPWVVHDQDVCGYAIQGRRFSMEDRMEVMTNLSMGDDTIDVYAVLDGHGGEFSVEFARHALMKKLRNSFKTFSSFNDSVTDVLRRDILETDKELIPLLFAQRDFSGCTLLVAVVHGIRLTVANVGDSRGIMYLSSGRVIPVSYDHKPDRADEKARIEAAGGTVVRFGVWRVSGILAMSRALGDYTLKNSKYVIADPDIRTFELDGDVPEFLLLATDGLWDTFANDDAGKFIKENLNDSDFGAKRIVVESFKRGSTDNISVMVVKISTPVRSSSSNGG